MVPKSPDLIIYDNMYDKSIKVINNIDNNKCVLSCS
jgi:hypothetical protein